MSWQIDGDGKAYVERDEDGRRPRQGAGSSGDKKWTHKDEQIPGEIAAVAQGLRVPPRWLLAEEQNCWSP